MPDILKTVLYHGDGRIALWLRCPKPNRRRLELSVWAAPVEQFTRTIDARYPIAQHTSHRGWLNLDILDNLNMAEARDLVLTS